LDKERINFYPLFGYSLEGGGKRGGKRGGKKRRKRGYVKIEKK
jgi:hypothetical protein